MLSGKGGVDVEALRRNDPRVAEVPFEAERKFSATVHADGTMFVKGAPEVVVERCTSVLRAQGARPLDARERAWFDETNQGMAERGLRVLAVAYREVDVAALPGETDALADRAEDLVLVGLVGILDPPRAEVRDAIALCKRAGIAKLDGGPKGATVQFHGDKYANPAGLVQFLNDQRGLAKIKDNRIVVRRDWPDEKARLVGAFQIARDLAGLAKPKAA